MNLYINQCKKFIKVNYHELDLSLNEYTLKKWNGTWLLSS